MRVTRLKFGYEISEIDYNSVHHAQFIKEKIADGRFVVLKNKNFVHPDIVANLYKNIGTLAVQSENLKTALPENRAFCRVSADHMFHGDPDRDHELDWHNAIQNRTKGEDIVCMYMQKNNCVGGEKALTDAQTAYDDLSESEKDLWSARQSLYKIYDFTSEDKEQLKNTANNSYFRHIYKNISEAFHFRDPDGKRAIDRQAQYLDVITEHPINKKKGFYFPVMVVKGFKGFEYYEGLQMRDKLINYLLQDKYVYWHKWDLYDIVLSDQIHSLHKRAPFKGERELWRSGIMLN